MKIIVPMAGRGSRLRPHTLTTPKPLIPIAGKPIVHRLVEDIAKVINQKIDEIAFIIHPDFGKHVEEELIKIAEKLGAKGTINYQNQALGTGHAIMCAKEALSGPVVVAYADTLFRADFSSMFFNFFLFCWWMYICTFYVIVKYYITLHAWLK